MGLTMSTVCVARLKKELKKLKKDPNQYFETVPLSGDIRTWHYVLKGPSDSHYANGYYHGVLKFPKDYPYKAPSIMLFTPNGRFQINTKICLSNSDFHPESWSPFWSVSNILTGFVSFMTEESKGVGSISSNEYHRKLLAKKSLAFNCRNPQFIKLFPKYAKMYQTQLKNRQKQSLLNNNNDEHTPLSQQQLPQIREQRDKMFDWLIIIVIGMALMYVWQNFM